MQHWAISFLVSNVYLVPLLNLSHYHTFSASLMGFIKDHVGVWIIQYKPCFHWSGMGRLSKAQMAAGHSKKACVPVMLGPESHLKLQCLIFWCRPCLRLLSPKSRRGTSPDPTCTAPVETRHWTDRELIFTVFFLFFFYCTKIQYMIPLFFFTGIWLKEKDKHVTEKPLSV